MVFGLALGGGSGEPPPDVPAPPPFFSKWMVVGMALGGRGRGGRYHLGGRIGH